MNADVLEPSIGSILIGRSVKMEPIEGSETSAFINQTPGNYPKGNLLYFISLFILTSACSSQVGL